MWWAAWKGLLPYTLLAALVWLFEKREKLVWEMSPIEPQQLRQHWLCLKILFLHRGNDDMLDI